MERIVRTRICDVGINPAMAPSLKERLTGPRELFHDEIVVLAVKHAPKLLRVVSLIGRAACEPLPDDIDPSRIGARLEYEVADSSLESGLIDYKRFVDIALTLDGRPVALLEIKSAKENQSASTWSRQVRTYQDRVGLWCSLAITHELPEYMREYLDLTDVAVLDLRKLGVVT